MDFKRGETRPNVVEARYRAPVSPPIERDDAPSGSVDRRSAAPDRTRRPPAKPAPSTSAAAEAPTVSTNSGNARGRMCPRCGMPLWDPNARQLREHDATACAAEVVRIDAAFDALDREPALNWLRAEW
jgi:hypothetical protein